MGFLGWIFLGLFAGTIARALAPGRPGPEGCIGTTAVGILGALLGEVIVEQEGEDLLELVERIRLAAIALRSSDSPDDRRAMAAEMDAIDLPRAEVLIRAFGLYFQLANLAEEKQRVRRLRSRARQAEHGLLDGSVAATSDNLLVYATSNRRHLMPEYMQENLEAHRVGDEIHPGETVEEKISLSERFGLWVSFHPFSQDQYLDIVRYWVAWHGASQKDSAALEREALQWALGRGSRSGRVAFQFARDWAGRHRARPPAAGERADGD